MGWQTLPMLWSITEIETKERNYSFTIYGIQRCKENLEMKCHLTCKHCDLDQTHETDSIDGVENFWKNWKREHGADLKCVHDYIVETLE
jgi:hypothetical protein